MAWDYIFGLKNMRETTLIDTPPFDKGPILHLSFWVDQKMRNRDWSQPIQMARDAVKRARAKGNGPNLIFDYDHDLQEGDLCFAQEPLSEQLNIFTLADNLDGAISEVIRRARAFTERFAEGLPDFVAI